jgi:tetratricopeptide (TPR) repeat protein
MTPEQSLDLTPEGMAAAVTSADLAQLLRQLRRREARRRGDSEWTYRELATRTGWSLGSISQYFDGKALAPTHRFDALVRLLGATPAELGALATARDRVEEHRRRALTRASHRAPSRPRQLPADVSRFTGRATQLAELDTLLTAIGRPTAPVMSVVSGTAGVGKTALAVHWAHQAAARFPDGQLYVNLRGYDPTPEMEPTEALAGFLQALGVDPDHIPATEEARAGLYRSLLAERRMLVILDNARGAEQVRPLLPGSSTCAVLITSRSDLPGLTALHGASRLALDVLTPAEALDLLVRLLDPERVGNESTALAELARLCAYLPLALRVAAALLSGRPDMTVTRIADQLRHGDRLARLAVAGDRQAAVSATFDLSYAALDADAQQLFRRLGLVPGPDFTADSAAHLIAAPVEDTEHLLERLATAHLVEPYTRSRFRFHDLLRLYAAHRAGLDDPAAERQASLERWYGFYQSCSGSALRLVQPAIWLLGQPPGDPQVRPLDFADRGAALDWLEAEQANVVAALKTAEHQPQPYVWELAESFGKYLWINGYGADALAVCQAGLAAARHSGNVQAEILMHTLLSGAHRSAGRHELTLAHLTQAVTQSQQIGDLSWEAISLIGLGTICRHLARLREAEGHLIKALAIHQKLSSPDIPVTRLYLGLTYQELGESDTAEAQLTEALAAFQEAGDLHRVVMAQSALARVRRSQGQFDQALEHAAEAYRVARETGLPVIEARAMLSLADACLDRARNDEARAHARAALQVARDTQNRRLEGQVLTTLADIHLQLGDYDRAADTAGIALTIHRDMGHRLYEARTLRALGQAVHHTQGLHAARAHWQQALNLYVAADSREADHLRDLIASEDL